MTLNSCRDYSDKAGALSSNIQPLFDVYLAYGSEDSSGNEQLCILIFPPISSTTYSSTLHIKEGKHEEESATFGQRKQGVEARRWLRMEGSASSQKHAGMEGRYINRMAALVQLTIEPPEILSHTESMNSALSCRESYITTSKTSVSLFHTRTCAYLGLSNIMHVSAFLSISMA